MSSTLKTSVSEETPATAYYTPHRIRHITSIQIRNLTTFPARDTFTSALTQPCEHSQFAHNGRLSDDLDVTLGRKRGRRISAASTLSSRNANSDNEGAGSPKENRRRVGSMSGRPLSASPVQSRLAGANGGTSPGQRRQSISIAPPSTSRPPLRQRLPSTASLAALPHNDSINEDETVESFVPVTLPSLLRDTSQAGLEQVLESRLVETYITITLPHSSFSDQLGPHYPATYRLASLSTLKANTVGGVGKRHAQAASVSPSTNRPRISPSNHSNPMSASAVSPGPDVRRSAPRSYEANTPSSSKRTLSEFDHEPDYRSPIHRPSTNPFFYLDARNELAESGADLSGSMLRVQVWGKIPVTRQKTAKEDGKGKAIDHGRGDEIKQWKVLDSWDVHLDDLVPLPKDYSQHMNHIPASTLFISLSPPDMTFYLPRSDSRAPSPYDGYSSDTGVGIRKLDKDREEAPVQDTGEISLSDQDHVDENRETGEEILPSLSSTWSTSRKSRRKTAGWQELLKLVNTQRVIQDTKASFADVVREIDQLVIHDAVGILTREVSERRAIVRELESQKAAVQDVSQNLRTRIDLKREELRIRRQTLSEARAALDEAVSERENIESEIREESVRLYELRSLIPPIRSSLISTLSFIYPIELASPPDLLFTILDVYLPIPVTPTDPAPPLSVPGRKDITPDVIATALGYAAQVVQLLSAYMSVGLTYPVTFVGSRSLVRDNISAMVGPRMFPLFSRGVDTYRFEYGVFLLNKDIEQLMSARDLRALDMRHTLPNIKNLMLTLSDGGATSTKPHRVDTDRITQSPTRTLTSLSSEPTVVESAPTSPPADDEPTTPKASAAGADTPTASNPSTISRKSRAFLDLSPLAGLLKGRYPSTSRTASASEPASSIDTTDDTNASSSHAEETTANGTISAGEQEDEDDRRTIREGAVEANTDTTEDKRNAKGRSNGTPASAVAAPVAAEEKVASEDVRPVISTPLDSVR